jgi:HEAT repeat protein
MRRIAVAFALAFIPGVLPAQNGDAGAVTAVLQAVRGASPLLCDLAARTLEQQWGWRSSYDPRAPRDAATRDVLRVVTERRAGPLAVAPLAAALADSDACVRRVAAPLLGRIEHASAQAAIRAALRHEAPETREAAAFTAGYAEDSALIPALLAALQDPVAHVRLAAAWALGEIEDERAIGALVRVLREDRDPAVRAAAAAAIGHIEG